MLHSTNVSKVSNPGLISIIRRNYQRLVFIMLVMEIAPNVSTVAVVCEIGKLAKMYGLNTLAGSQIVDM